MKSMGKSWKYTWKPMKFIETLGNHRRSMEIFSKFNVLCVKENWLPWKPLNPSQPATPTEFTH